jgi:hypothetical protein
MLYVVARGGILLFAAIFWVFSTSAVCASEASRAHPVSRCERGGSCAHDYINAFMRNLSGIGAEHGLGNGAERKHAGFDSGLESDLLLDSKHDSVPSEKSEPRRSSVTWLGHIVLYCEMLLLVVAVTWGAAYQGELDGLFYELTFFSRCPRSSQSRIRG